MKIIKKNIKWIILITALLFVPAIAPSSYIMQIVANILLYIILAMGLNLLTGFTGILSLGHAAFFGLGAYTAAILNTRFGMPFPVTLICAVVVTGVAGVLLAIPSLRVKGSYLVLLTIGFGEVVRLILINWVDFTKWPSGIIGIQYPDFGIFKLDSLYLCYYLILFFVVILMVYQIILMKSRVGRAMLAIRDDDNAAELCGIDIARYKIKAFVISAVYCAIAGCLYAHVIRYVSPDSFRGEESQIILCCVIVGGMATFKGPVIGAFLLTMLPEILRGLDNFRMVLYGIMLIIVIIFFPGGIAGYLDRFKVYLKKKTGKMKGGAEPHKGGGRL